MTKTAPKTRQGKADPPADLDLGLLPGLLGYRLRRAQLAVFNDFMATVGAEGTGLTPGQFGLLALIGANRGVSQSRLARAIGVDRSTIMTTLARLEDLGWITREPSPTDRRALSVALSAKGRTALRRAKARVRSHEARIARALSADERATLMALLARISPAGAEEKER